MTSGLIRDLSAELTDDRCYLWHTWLAFTPISRRLVISAYRRKFTTETYENNSWTIQVIWVEWERASLLDGQPPWLFQLNGFCFLKQLKTIRPLKIKFPLKNASPLDFTYDSEIFTLFNLHILSSTGTLK